MVVQACCRLVAVLMLEWCSVGAGKVQDQSSVGAVLASKSFELCLSSLCLRSANIV